MGTSGTPSEYVDVHVHVLPEERSHKLMRWVRRAMPEHPVPIEITPDEIVRDLKEHGARCFWNLVFPIGPGESRALNHFNVRVAERFPRVLPFATAHPDEEDKEGILEEAFDELGLVGLKLHPMVTRFQPWQDAMQPIYAACDARSKPIVMHSGYDEFYGYGYGVDQLENIARTYPNITLILSHLIFPQVREAFDLVARYPNVYLDATNVFGSLIRLRPQLEKSGVANDAITQDLLAGFDRHSDRIVFGTDHPAGVGDVGTILADMFTVDLSPAQRQAMLLDTPTRLSEQFDTGWLRD